MIRYGSDSKLRSAAGQPADVLRLQLKAGGRSNATIIALVEGASEGYKAGEDIYKLFSPLTSVPEIYTVVDETAIEINVTNADADNTLIPVGIKAPVTKAMELSVTGAGNIRPEMEVYLIDREENKRYDLRKQSVISFDKESEENLEGRFYISFETRASTGIENQPGITNAIQVFKMMDMLQ
jgi:hypothetical protein